MRKFTDEEIQWVIDYPDYPIWLIVDEFEKKFGRSISKNYTTHLRIKARGTSNMHHPIHKPNYKNIKVLKAENAWCDPDFVIPHRKKS